MPNVLVDVPAELLNEIDAIVTLRKREARAQPSYVPTPAEKHRAWEIAEKQGVSFANAYLKSLSPAKGRSPSRVSVVLELLQIALCSPQSQQAIKAAAEPVASKFPEPRRPAKPQSRAKK